VIKHLKHTEIRERLLSSFKDMEKATEKGLSKTAAALKTLERKLELQPDGTITAEIISTARSALSLGKIGEAQKSVAGLIRLLDAAEEKTE
jgi:hypothetical protein